MGEFWGRLFSPDGFVARKNCGGAWTDGLVWLHVGSDLAIWLAYLSLPLVLLYFVRRKRDVPFSWLFVLFALFILACGFGHLYEAMMFHYPAYRAGGLVKAGTAVVSWATVIALVPAVPKIDDIIARVTGGPADAPPARPLPRGVGAIGYIVALLAASLAVLVRAALDPFLGSDHAFVLALLAVVYVAWQCGFGPAVAALVVSMAGIVFFFVEPRGSFTVTRVSDQVAVAAFFFCGVGCAALGHAQRESNRRAVTALHETLSQQAVLEGEMTRRAAAEDSLRSQQADFQLLADNISQFAWITDETGYITWYNQRWFDYTGTTIDEMRGWGWKSVHHPEHVARVAEKFARHIAAGEPWEDTFPLRGADGHYRWFLSRALPVRSPEGKVVRWFGTNTDVTDQRQAEADLRAQEARFRTLADFVPQIVWVTKPDGYHEYYNRRWYEFTGVGAGATDGEGWNGMFHPDDRARAWAKWRHSLDTGDPYEIEYRLRAADGTYRWFLGQARPQRDDTGAVIRWFGTCTDIDDQKRQADMLERLVEERTRELSAANTALRTEVEERRRAEEREVAAAQELRRSNAELEQFAYVASHDLQEPLRKIQAFGDLLHSKHAAALPEEAKGYVRKMQTSAGRMSRLIDDLLAYSRVTTHTRPFTRVDLGTTVKDVLEDLELRTAKAGGRIEVGPLPVIDGDPGQLRQLFQNLIGNALKFHRRDVPPVVRVAAEPAAGGWEVRVEDNGIGFEDRHRERIFQVFQRLHGRDEFDGTGVGLAICKKIAERHGGGIDARGRPGEGATFVVSFPAPPPDPTR